MRLFFRVMVVFYSPLGQTICTPLRILAQTVLLMTMQMSQYPLKELGDTEVAGFRSTLLQVPAQGPAQLGDMPSTHIAGMLPTSLHACHHSGRLFWFLLCLQQYIPHHCLAPILVLPTRTLHLW